ncbi:glycosyltransferase [Vibrio chemaguriensis]
MKKKLLVVNKQYHPFVGGVETVAKQYAEWGVDSGFDVTVLCLTTQKNKRVETEVINGVKVVRVYSFLKIYSLPLSLSFFCHLYKMTKSADIVHAHYPFPLFDIIFPFLSRKPKYIVTWHSDIIRQKLFRIILSPFTKYMVSKVKIITTSPKIRQFSGLLSKKDCSVLPLSIEPPKEMSYKGVRIAKVDALGRLIPQDFALFLGRFSYYKGVKFLLDTCRDNLPKNVNVLMVGSGEMLSYAKDFIQHNDMNNVFLVEGHVSEEEKHAYFELCKFFIFPSIFRSEAFGITQLEAMSHSKPVINTLLNSGVPWVSQHGITGLSVPVNNKEKLSDAIALLYSDASYAMKLGNSAKERSRLFETSEIKQRYIEFLNF